MEEKELKTSFWQRLGIILVAVVMVGTIIASYVAIVANGGGGSDDEYAISDEKLLEYETAYMDKVTEFQAATSSEYSSYSQFISRIAAYDEAAANELSTTAVTDLVAGSGRELTAGDTDYIAFYAGWCADGTVFDSSLDSTSEPSGFASGLPASSGLITGWTNGVVGMKLGGVRELTIPGTEAYQDTREICGGYFKPLKFLIMAVENTENLSRLVTEVREASLKVSYGYYGLDYEKLLTN